MLLGWQVQTGATEPYVYVAYFAPFSYEQHLALIADCAARLSPTGQRLPHGQ